MDNANNITSKISKLFIIFGIILLLISTIDIFDIIFPLNISMPEWVFNVSQSFINSLAVPALSIVLLLAGIFLKENYTKNKKFLIFEKLISIISFGFGLAVCISLLLYSLSMKAYEVKTISSIKTQGEAVIKQLEQIYNVKESKIPETLYKQKVSEVKEKINYQQEQTKNLLFRKNIKMIIEMMLYIALYFLIGVISFNSAKNKLVELKLS